MPMDIATFRKLVAIDENDPLSRYALSQALVKEGSAEALREAADHLGFACEKAPDHIATYQLYGEVLIKLGRTDEARKVLTAGIAKANAAGEHMGRDLGPVMEEMLEAL